MDEGEAVGRFHCSRVVNGLPVASPEWRVTTHERAVAVAVARLLAGEVVDCRSEAGGWEVLSEAKNVRIVVEAVEELALFFRLVDVWGLGVFEFRSEAWTLVERLGQSAVESAAARGYALGELAIQPVLFTTLVNGTSVLHLRPSLRVSGYCETAA